MLLYKEREVRALAEEIRADTRVEEAAKKAKEKAKAQKAALFQMSPEHLAILNGQTTISRGEQIYRTKAMQQYNASLPHHDPSVQQTDSRVF